MLSSNGNRRHRIRKQLLRNATINGLHSEGYIVQLNGAQTAPLTACTVTNVQKDPLGGNSLTAQVDVACPDGC
ncbi:hypothetical protein TUM20983_22700 [Mycobacterium antarcticum]|nr:hypothetical protein TUM20983_22700 [Mycolicibacterium sp. TUM20983]